MKTALILLIAAASSAMGEIFTSLKDYPICEITVSVEGPSRQGIKVSWNRLQKKPTTVQVFTMKTLMEQTTPTPLPGTVAEKEVDYAAVFDAINAFFKSYTFPPSTLQAHKNFEQWVKERDPKDDTFHSATVIVESETSRIEVKVFGGYEPETLNRAAHIFNVLKKELSAEQITILDTPYKR